MTSGNITLPQELLPRLEELARLENRTADDIAAEAVKQLLVRRFWEQNQSKAAIRRGAMSDEEVGDSVERAVREVRSELGSR